jgi:hypothetical protein
MAGHIRRRFEIGEDVLGDALSDALLKLQGANKINPGALLRLPPRPDWRGGTLAPGVESPGEGLVALPLTPQANNGVFAAAFPAITFQGQLQKPYRPERFLMPAAVRTGPSATGIILGKFWVGTDLQAADIQGLPLETLGAVTAFDTRMSFNQAAPGVLMRIEATITPAPTGGDTVSAQMFFLGAVVF